MMILTEYLIDVLSRLSCLVAAIAMLTCVVALYSALKESITINPSKAKLGFCVFIAFLCMCIFIIMPNQEIIRCLVEG